MRVAPMRGYHPQELTPSRSVRVVRFLVGNDRQQVILVHLDGANFTMPTFRYWTAGPPAWDEALAVGDPSQVVEFYATDENDVPVEGVLELPVRKIANGQEASIDGIRVTIEPRPAVLGGFDGGLDSLASVRVDGQVWGIGHVGARATDTGLAEGVVASSVESFEIPASSIGSMRWPNEITVWLACSLEQRSHDVRVRFPLVRHCRIKHVEVWGRIHNSVVGL